MDRPESRAWDDVAEVAERHGVPLRRLSHWRKLARRGELTVAPVCDTEGPFAAVTSTASALRAFVSAPLVLRPRGRWSLRSTIPQKPRASLQQGGAVIIGLAADGMEVL